MTRRDIGALAAMILLIIVLTFIGVATSKVSLTAEELKTVSEIIQTWCAVIAVFVGGIWVLWRFVLQREAHPKIEIALDLHVLGIVKDEWLINVTAIVTNRGQVRHYLSDFWFNLHPLDDATPLTIGGSEIAGQVRFAKSDRQRYWIEPKRDDFFIDPGVMQRYTHVTAIPLATKFVLIYGRFRYPKSRGKYHSAQQAFVLASGSRATAA